jgi:hypothetical protein
MFLRNVGNHLKKYMVSQHRGPQYEGDSLTNKQNNYLRRLASSTSNSWSRDSLLSRETEFQHHRQKSSPLDPTESEFNPLQIFEHMPLIHISVSPSQFCLVGQNSLSRTLNCWLGSRNDISIQVSSIKVMFSRNLIHCTSGPREHCVY